MSLRMKTKLMNYMELLLQQNCKLSKFIWNCYDIDGQLAVAMVR